MSGKDNRVANQQLLKAVSNPFRIKILEAMADREQSPKQVAERLRHPLVNVVYHISVLRECGVIEPVRAQQRRGTLEHFYRPDASTQRLIDLFRATFG
jgi:DNA-binding transcriptional ArsR family regulator